MQEIMPKNYKAIWVCLFCTLIVLLGVVGSEKKLFYLFSVGHWIAGVYESYLVIYLILVGMVSLLSWKYSLCQKLLITLVSPLIVILSTKIAYFLALWLMLGFRGDSICYCILSAVALILFFALIPLSYLRRGIWGLPLLLFSVSPIGLSLAFHTLNNTPLT